MLEPLNKDADAILMEFKVRSPKKERNLEETVQEALAQIEKKGYVQSLMDKGFPEEQIRKYGFAFDGKEVLIG